MPVTVRKYGKHKTLTEAQQPGAFRGRARTKAPTVEQMESYGRVHLTRKHIADLHGATVYAVDRWFSEDALRAAYQRGRANCVSGIRVAQIKKALAGDPTMLRYAGAKFADQDDAVKVQTETKVVHTWDDVALDRARQIAAEFGVDVSDILPEERRQTVE